MVQSALVPHAKETEAMKKNSTPSSVRWLWRISGKLKRSVLRLMLLQMLLGISSVGFVWLLRGLIDAAVDKNRQQFWYFSAGLFGLTVFQLAMRAVLRFLLEYTKATAENRLKERLFSVLLSKDYAAVTAVHSEEWMNRLTSDTAVTAEGLSTILPEVAGMLVKLVGALFLLLYLLPGSAWILLPAGLLFGLLTYGFRKRLKRLHKNIQEADGRLRVFLSERLASLLVVRSFAGERQSEAEAGVRMEEHRAARMKRNRFSNLCNTGFGILMSGVYLLGAVCCGYGILMGTLSYGTFTAVLQLIGQIRSPFANLTGYLPKYYAMLASAERLMEAERFPDGCTAAGTDKETIREFYRREFRSMGLRGASFTYSPKVRQGVGGGTEAGEKPPVVIRNMNLEIEKGEYVAFTGASGCGKSTLLKLLMCLYPLDAGDRYLRISDGREIPLDGSYIRLFAYVPQGNHLMSGSIRETVAFADAAPDDAAVWNALRIACVDDAVKGLPDGLDTLLGERGTGLSEGQLQRIAIARAVYSDNPVLMLDESTSALDVRTEERLLNNLRAMTDKTVLLVTHRPAILAICDRQVIMKENHVTEVCRRKGEAGNDAGGTETDKL